MKAVLDSLEYLYQKLVKHPKVQVLNYRIYPSIGSAFLQKYLADKNISLSKDILAFYEECNGFLLRWIHRDAPNFDPQKHIRNDEEGEMPLPVEILMGWDTVKDIETKTTGCIYILGFQDVFYAKLDHYLEERQPYFGKEINDLSKDIDIVWDEYLSQFGEYEWGIKENVHVLDIFANKAFMGIDINDQPISEVFYCSEGELTDESVRIDFKSYLCGAIEYLGMTDRPRFGNASRQEGINHSNIEKKMRCLDDDEGL